MTVVLSPRHRGSHTPSWEDLSPFLEGACCYARSYHGLRQSPRDSAAHNNILMQPRCSCWCQCLVTHRQTKAENDLISVVTFHREHSQRLSREYIVALFLVTVTGDDQHHVKKLLG